MKILMHICQALYVLLAIFGIFHYMITKQETSLSLAFLLIVGGFFSFVFASFWPIILAPILEIVIITIIFSREKL